MTISHMAGTLQANKIVGSNPIGYSAAKITTGSFVKSRVFLYQGTPITLAGSPLASQGTRFRNARSPPGTPRWVSIAFTVNPTAAGTGSGASLVQNSFGTIGVAHEDKAAVVHQKTVTLEGPILPGRGSWQLRVLGTMPIMKNWSEYQLMR